MLRIAITPTDILPDEPARITMILDHGWDYVHLRHPDASLRDIKNVIEKIPQRLHRRIRLHGHFELLNEFNLGGIHLNSRCPSPPELYKGSISRTCHSLAEVEEWMPKVEYMTLSPIFDSLSKAGYKKGFNHEQLASLPSGKVVALGGVEPSKIKELRQYPFVGFAMLGYLFDGGSIESLKAKLQLLDEAQYL